MKKTGLFKIIMFVLLGILVVTWFVPASYFNSGTLSDLGMYRIGFFDFFQLLFGAFEFDYFLQMIILLVSIGALYGVLEKTGKYRALIEKISSKFKGKELVFLIGVAFLIAALTSVFDYSLVTFIFFPFIIGIILTMGYDKITAFMTTIGSYLIGIIGSTINVNIVSNINNVLSDVTLSTGIYYRLIIFVLTFGLLVYYLVNAKKKKSNKSADIELFIGEKISNKYPVCPIIVVFSLLFVLMVLGCTGWETTFGVSVFKELNTTITEFTIKDFAIFKYVLGNISAFGEWHYAEMAVMCLLASLVAGLMYRFKAADIFTNMLNGAKKMIIPALLVALTYAVVFFVGNTMFFPTIAGWILGATSKFNLFFASITTILGSALHVDMLYFTSYVSGQLAANASNHMIVELMTQGLYGVTMFAVPTSAMLVLGLSYLGVSYKEYMKSLWKYILGLLGIVVIVLLIAMFV